ncbi:MAG: glycosyltransferase family 2 protein [Bacteroidia bacterium]|nr:glycosyltransferase family 2 protein [Bacteroidia bacterium]
MTPVTVVILNWNGKSWLEKFLPSVVASSYEKMEILVVDNASTDDSVTFLHKNFPSVRVEVLDSNYGFAGGYNLSLPFVHTPYLVLLNSDVEVDPDWLGPLVEMADADPAIAAVQPKIRAIHDRESFEYAGAAGGFIDFFAYPFCRGRLFDIAEKDSGQYDAPLEIFWATGACCLVRKRVVEEIGLFEGEFFAHMEEIDFCWRAKNYGYKIMYQPQSVVYHVGGGALPKSNPHKTFLNVRNSLACMYRNLPQGQVFFRMLVRLVLDGVWGFRSLLRWDWGTIGAIIQAHWAFFRKIPHWRKRRREIYPQLPTTMPQGGYYPRSVVWLHFGKGIKHWQDLPSIKS